MQIRALKHKNKLDSSSVGFRLGLCAAALAGTAATAPMAQAGIVTFNTPVSIPNSFDGIYINLLTGANGVSAASVPGWDFDPYSGAPNLLFFWNNAVAGTSGGVSSAGLYTDLADGSLVGPGSTFIQNAQTGTDAFRSSGSHILGFRFFNENTSATNYGYLTLTTTASTGFPATIQGWTVDDSGAAITVSANPAGVPEPSTAGLLTVAILAFGASGIRRNRRKLAAK